MSTNEEHGLRERKKRAVRRALQLSCLELVAEHGLAAVTIESVASSAGVSPRTFFNYFSSKEEALFALDTDELEEAVAQLAAGFDGASPFEAVHATLREMMSRAERDPRGMDLRRTVVEREPALLSHLIGATADAEQRFVGALTRRMAGTPRADGYAELLVAACWAAMRLAVVQWRKDDKRHSLVDRFDHYLGLVGDGLRTPPPGAAS